MEACAAIGDGLGGPTARGFEISKFLLSRPSSVLVISAVGMLSVDSIAPPRKVVRSDPQRAVPRAFVRRTRKTRRRSITDDDDGGSEGCFGDWDGDDGSFGGGSGGGGGGGRWWNFEGRGGPDWGEWGSSSASSDPAFDVVYGVICCIALYSCSGFAFKRICRFLANKEKMALLRLIPHFAS